MATEHMKILAAAFEKAVALEGEEQASFLGVFERDHPDLAPRLRRMLASDASNEDILRSWVARETVALAEESHDPWVGKTLGAWTIKRRIGSGGMGAVFLADRSDTEFAQTAAIKVMSAQILSENAADRFRFERQTLANLSHPNIATLIDGGSTDLNLPYIVMEFVEGAPINAYCDAAKLDLRARLALFRKVCAGVDYAHRNLIVHRDLKPDNILVNADGEPKLLDFGVAKLLENHEAATDSVETSFERTQPGSRVMTLDYASPEQIRGEPVSIAADIYALGVLLYRLLTGVSPYGDDRKSAHDLERAILTLEPKPPSTTSTQAQSGGADSDIHRVTTPSDEVRYKKRLSGDLDNIVLKCLQKEPDRRYATAKELSDDIERYLNNEPVEARGNHWTYVFGKFVARNKNFVTALAGAFLMTVGLVTFYTVQLSSERDKAQRAAVKATHAAAQAEEVSGFLSTLFESASPYTAEGNVITAIDLLDSGVKRIDTLSGQPILQSNLFRIMGYSYTEIGDAKRGLELHEQSVAVLDDVDSVDPLLLAKNLSGLAEAQRVLEYHDASIENRRRTIELLEKNLGNEHPDTIYARVRLGTSLESAGRADEALVQLREAREVSERVSEGYDEVLLDSMGVGAVILSNLGQYHEAELLNAGAIKHSKIVLGELNPNTIIRIRNTGVYLREQFKLEEALVAFVDARKRGETVWPAESPLNTYSFQQEAVTLQFLGRFEEAWALYEATHLQSLAGPGENSLEFSFQLAMVAGWRFEMGQYQEALVDYRRSYEIAVGLNGMDTRRAVEAEIGIGQSLAALGELSAAESMLRDALARSKSLRVHTKLICARTLASVVSRSGAFDEADQMFRTMIAEKESHVGPDNAALVPFLIEEAAHERRKGDPKAAHFFAERAYRLSQAGLPKGNWIAALAEAEYARVVMAQGDVAEAVTRARAARESVVATFGNDHPFVAEIDAITKP